MKLKFSLGDSTVSCFILLLHNLNRLGNYIHSYQNEGTDLAYAASKHSSQDTGAQILKLRDQTFCPYLISVIILNFDHLLIDK